MPPEVFSIRSSTSKEPIDRNNCMHSSIKLIPKEMINDNDHFFFTSKLMIIPVGIKIAIFPYKFINCDKLSCRPILTDIVSKGTRLAHCNLFNMISGRSNDLLACSINVIIETGPNLKRMIFNRKNKFTIKSGINKLLRSTLILLLKLMLR